MFFNYYFCFSSKFGSVIEVETEKQMIKLFIDFSLIL